MIVHSMGLLYFYYIKIPGDYYLDYFFPVQLCGSWGRLMLATTQSREVRSASMNNSEVSSWQQ